MRIFITLTAVAALALFHTQPGLAQETGEELKALRKEVETLKKGQVEIQKDLQEIKTLLRGRPTAAPAEPRDLVLTVDGAPFKGERNATVTLIDFSDYQ